MLRVGVVGSGLIGGSILRALNQREDIRLLAFDRRPETSAEIREVCPEVATYQLPEPLTREEGGASVRRDGQILRTAYPEEAAALASCDLIVFCTPVQLIPRQAALVSELSSALLSDVGSTKAELCSALEGKRFIGAHPMAGSERQGFVCSRADMFENAPYVLCPPPTADYPANLEADLALLERFAGALGAASFQLTPEEHDDVVAYVSHLPHVAAAALVNTVGHSSDHALGLSAGGFRDITRIASSHPGLWAEISLSSRAALIPALDNYMEDLQAFRAALETEDGEALYALFNGAQSIRSQLPLAGTGALLAASGLTVYIEDTPGSLHAVTSLLADAGISIRNMSLQNARQYEGGQLRLYVSDPTEQAKSLAILKEQGYDCEA